MGCIVLIDPVKKGAWCIVWSMHCKRRDVLQSLMSLFLSLLCRHEKLRKFVSSTEESVHVLWGKHHL